MKSRKLSVEQSNIRLTKADGTWLCFYSRLIFTPHATFCTYVVLPMKYFVIASIHVTMYNAGLFLACSVGRKYWRVLSRVAPYCGIELRNHVSCWKPQLVFVYRFNRFNRSLCVRVFNGAYFESCAFLNSTTFSYVIMSFASIWISNVFARIIL